MIARKLISVDRKKKPGNNWTVTENKAKLMTGK